MWAGAPVASAVPGPLVPTAASAQSPPGRKLISFVFFGLPEIEQNLKLDPPLHQRVALKYRLEPFDLSSTQAYVKHRLRLAGAPRNPFQDEAVQAIHRFSRGLPRVVNTLCDNALFEAFLARQAEVDPKIVERIAADLGLREQVEAEERKGRRDEVYSPPGAPAERGTVRRPRTSARSR